MGKGKQGETNEQTHPEERVFWIVGLGLVTMAIVPGVFVFFFHSLDWGGPTDWATFATYFSGVATPIVALCSALLFFRSIKVQRDEFEKTREEMKKATKLQHQVEESRQALFRQEQLEQSIPKARERQVNSYQQFMKQLNQRRNVQEGPYPHGIIREISIDEVRKKDENPNILVKLLYPYFFDTKHLSIMLSRYITAGGDVYYFLDLIHEIEAEFDLMGEVAAKYEITFKQEYKGYAQNVNTLRSAKNTALQYYEHKLYQ